MEHIVQREVVRRRSSGRLGWLAYVGLAAVAGAFTAKWVACARSARKRERRLDEDVESTMDASDPIAKY